MILGLAFTIFIVIGFIGAMAEIIRQKMLPPEKQYNGPRPPKINPSDIVADAKALGFTIEEVKHILCKRFPYYNSLNNYQQHRFVSRTIRFIQHKLFIIKSDTGFREMAVLASASAIQLTFGLDNFLLPWYRYIQIYPEEFLSEHSLKILAGNVSNHTITIAWNHLLKGYEDGADGCNVALHEMSHALYFQNVEVEKMDAYSFCNRFQSFIDTCKPVYKEELRIKGDLYTAYGIINLQEFWAESVELFFEKSLLMKKAHPRIYASLVNLLNQDPLTEEKVIDTNVAVVFHRLIGLMWHWQRKLFAHQA